MKSIQLLLIYWLVVFPIASHSLLLAQSHKINPSFSILNTEEGFPTNEIQEVYQDKEGFMWFATRNGLCKYDGYQMTVYSSDRLSPDELISNNVFCLADDEHGSLWIGTNNGVDRYDKLSGRFENIEIKNRTNKVVSCILITSKNEVWIGLDDGLFRYDRQKNCFTYHGLLDGGDLSLTPSVKSLVEDSRGEIWIGTWADGLYRYSPLENTLHSYPQMNPRNSAHVVYEDSRKNIWVGTWEGGLQVLENPYDTENIRWETFRHDPKDPHSLSDNIVYDICEDVNTNSLWVGTRGGLSIYEYGPKVSFQNWSTTHADNKLPTNEINSILRDNKNNIWMGSIGGGVLFTNTKEYGFELIDINLPGIPTGAVRSVFTEGDDTMWMGIGTYGLVRYDKKTGKITSQTEIPEFKDMGLTTIYEIKKRANGEILFGTYGNGLWVYREGEPLIAYTRENSSFISDNRIRSIYIDRQQRCWLGTQYGLGVWMGDQEGYSFREIPVDNNHLEHTSLIDITEDDEGRIWIATADNGILSVEGSMRSTGDFLFRHYSPENGKIPTHAINVLYHDANGRLWAGTENGKLLLYEKHTDSFVDKSPPFTVLGTLISSIEEDRQGNLWIGTNNGLVKISFDSLGRNNGYRVFTLADGLRDNFFIPKSSCEYQGELFFGGYHGLAKFNPDHITADTYPTPFYITDIRFLNRSYHKLDASIKEKISDKEPAFSERLTIPHGYNNFSIHFANLNYKHTELNRYAYRLIGQDTEWNYTDSKQNTAYFNNLMPGEYVFQLRATTQNGMWNDKIKEIKINVLPPFWFSWWALMIYICILGVIAYIIYRNMLHRLRLRNQLELQEVEQQKTEELNHAKLQFFTNVTHELLTPITIISTSMDELQHTSPRNDDMYMTISRNINRLTRLLQQILEFRKAEAGNLRLRVSYGNISSFIKKSTESFYPLTRSKKLHFSFVSDPSNILGLFDPDKLDKILYNLVSNAIKYVSKGGFIQVTLKKDNDCIRLEVEDNGAGIAQEDQPALFKRFYEGNYRRYNTTGTGLGLSLVKDLVELYHGKIFVDSDIGKGSKFTVVLPIEPSYFEEDEVDVTDFVEDPNQQSTGQRVHHSNGTSKIHCSHSILVVEDNPEVLNLVGKLLSREYHVLTATDGKEAFSVLKENNVDLIISDIMMPEMDGIELCKMLKNNIEYSHIPIVLLTAKSEEQDRAIAYESGADAFISKPFSLNVLNARIKNLLISKERAARDFKTQLVFEIKDLEYTNLDEQFIKKAIDSVNQHLDNPDFGQEQFAEEMNVSKSTLYNKLRTLTGLNTSAFITNIRLKAACKIMSQNPGIRISDLAYDVGFNDPKYFSSCFKKEFKMRPSEYLEKITITTSAT